MPGLMIASYPRPPGYDVGADLFAASGTFRRISRQWPQPRAIMATYDS
jgi:hypothetical protein